MDTKETIVLFQNYPNKIGLFIMNELLLSIVGDKIYENVPFSLFKRDYKVWYEILITEDRRNYIKLKNKLIKVFSK
jgi:hypothetical protein